MPPWTSTLLLLDRTVSALPTHRACPLAHLAYHAAVSNATRTQAGPKPARG